MSAGLRNLYIITLLLVCIPLFQSCVTQKKKDDVGAIGKVYHNTTARYNGYYNANLLLQESIVALEQQHQDNYNQILPVYKYVEADNPAAQAQNLDNAIKKVTVVINLHRVSQWTDDSYLLLGQAQYLKKDYESALETFEFLVSEYDPKEVAKREAQSKTAKQRKKTVAKGGKDPAPSSAAGKDAEVKLTKKQKERIAKKEKKEREKERKQKIKESKKRRKSGQPAPKTTPKPASATPAANEPVLTNQTKLQPAEKTTPAVDEGLPAPGSISLGGLQPQVADSDPDGYFLKHRPAHQEGLLWLARTYIERESFTNAERLLLQLERSPSTFKDVRRETAVAKAHFFLKQKQFDSAIEPVNTAIQLSDDPATKARLSFILGQIYQKNGNGVAAYSAFEQVLKYQSIFEMDFRASLNLATAGVISNDESVRQLDRMLKEEKNKEYVDQIYFALAQLALKSGNQSETIRNLELSLQTSTRNISQKAESYLQLADLYFENQSFVKAKLYYDNTLLVLSNLDERYNRVNKLASNLDGIAENIQIITLQDSLLRISRMTDAERRDLANDIKKKKDEERLAALKAQIAQQAPGATRPSTPVRGPQQSAGGNQSSFFAYNDRSVKAGQREFEKRWGTRNLDDNWRLSNRRGYQPEGDALANKTRVSSNLSQEDINALLQGVPETPDEILYANRQIEVALFSLGSLYRDRLQNYPKAIEALTQLLERFPDTQYELDALYYLYLSHKEIGGMANAEKYYARIVSGFPGTNYAKILQDPNYNKTIADQGNKLAKYYDETYALFSQRQYQLAHNKINQAPELFGTVNAMSARFALLNAMCVGNLMGRANYVEALQDIIAKFPEEQEASRAREILRLLGENVGTGPGMQRNTPAAEGQFGPYKPNDDKLHYVIIVFHTDISLNDAKVVVSDYNNKYHSLDNLRMNNIYLGDGDTKMPIIAIRRYTDKKEAMAYYNSAQKNKKDFLDVNKFNYEVFPIEQDNYRELLKSKNIDKYRAFFQASYLK